MKRDRTPPPRITRRALMLLGIQAGVIGALGWRMRDLQIVQNEHYKLLAEENRVNLRLIPPARGIITDREGRLLAGNRQNYRIVMVREQARDPKAVLARLATIIDLPPERQERALQEMNGRSAFVPVVVTEHLSWDDVVRVAANTPVLPGVMPEVGLSRYYPDGPSTAHVIGYVGPVAESDLAKLEAPDPLLQIPRFQIGKTGIEFRLEPELRGQAGNLKIEVSAAGRVMRELGRVEGTPGKDMQLTLDLGLQAYAMKRMAGQSCCGRGDRRAQRRHPRPRLGAGVRPEQLRLRHPLGGVERAPQRRVPPARQQDGDRHLPARLDLQDRHGARGARRRRRQPRRRRRLRRRHLSRRPPLPLLEEGRPRPGRAALEPRPVLRLLLLRDGPPPRPRPDQRDGEDPRARRPPRPADAGGVGRQHARRRVEEGEPQRELDHRRQLQLRHRPGLHPRLAAAARGDDRPRRERHGGEAADDPRGRRRARTGPGARAARPRPAPPELGARRHVRGLERRHRLPLAHRRADHADGGQDRHQPGPHHHRRRARRRRHQERAAAVAAARPRALRLLRALRQPEIRGGADRRARRRRLGGGGADRPRHPALRALRRAAAAQRLPGRAARGDREAARPRRPGRDRRGRPR